MAFLSAEEKAQMGKDITKNLSQRARHWGIMLLDQILPPRCLSCGAGTQDAGRLCPSCWKGLSFLQGPACRCCGYPFEFEATPGEATLSLCGACQKKHPPFDRARAAVRYDEGSRKMIISFKHGDRMEYADFFAQLLLQANQSLVAPNPIVIPVPLHKKRLQKRRYNQAAVVAKIFARHKKLTFLPDVMTREKHTPPQEGNYQRRKRNVAGAFRITPRYQQVIRGRNIILVDDVYTTGATVRACAIILRQKGVRKIEVLTLARVYQPSGL